MKFHSKLNEEHISLINCKLKMFPNTVSTSKDIFIFIKTISLDYRLNLLNSKEDYKEYCSNLYKEYSNISNGLEHSQFYN